MAEIHRDPEDYTITRREWLGQALRYTGACAGAIGAGLTIGKLGLRPLENWLEGQKESGLRETGHNILQNRRLQGYLDFPENTDDITYVHLPADCKQLILFIGQLHANSFGDNLQSFKAITEVQRNISQAIQYLHTHYGVALQGVEGQVGMDLKVRDMQEIHQLMKNVLADESFADVLKPETREKIKKILREYERTKAVWDMLLTYHSGALEAERSLRGKITTIGLENKAANQECMSILKEMERLRAIRDKILQWSIDDSISRTPTSSTDIPWSAEDIQEIQRTIDQLERTEFQQDYQSKVQWFLFNLSVTIMKMNGDNFMAANEAEKNIHKKQDATMRLQRIIDRLEELYATADAIAKVGENVYPTPDLDAQQQTERNIEEEAKAIISDPNGVATVQFRVADVHQRWQENINKRNRIAVAEMLKAMENIADQRPQAPRIGIVVYGGAHFTDSDAEKRMQDLLKNDPETGFIVALAKKGDYLRKRFAVQ